MEFTEVPESINLFNGYWSDLKTRRLIGLIGRGAAELPLRLWTHCNMHHPQDGYLAGYSAQEIESIVEWWGKPGELVAALVKVGFLDKMPAGDYAAHNWQQRNPHAKAYHERAKAAAAARWEKRSARPPPEEMLQASPSNACALHCNALNSKTDNDSESSCAQTPPNLTPQGLAWRFRSLVKGRPPNSQESEDGCAAVIEELITQGVGAKEIFDELQRRGKHVETIWAFAKRMTPKANGVDRFAGLKMFADRAAKDGSLHKEHGT